MCGGARSNTSLYSSRSSLCSELGNERALQAVDATVALAYWDFTIDKYHYDAGNWSSLLESPLWSPEWFGATGGAPYRQCVRQGAALLSQILVREGRWPDCDVLARLWNETSQDGVFVDAGANIGSCSLMMLSPGLRRNHMSKAPRRRDSAQASARQRSRSSRCPSTISTSRRACSPIRGCASD